MDKNNGGAAFPRFVPDGHYNGSIDEQGMTLRDYFAIRAPEPSKERLERERQSDKNRNPYNEPHKPPLRSDTEIRCVLAYEYADAMLCAREQ